MSLRVAVVGGGLGGLCLAQGLRRNGIEVTVHERDAGLGSRRQGYRIHLDDRAGNALAECLPPALHELFLATLGAPGTTFSVVDERLKVLHRTSFPTSFAKGTGNTGPTRLSAPANRQTLREVLAAGLGDALAFGHDFVSYEHLPHGVRLRFADGWTSDADVLVAADGSGSRVRRQYLPGARVVDTGARCIYGKTLLDEETLALVPPALSHGFTAVIGSGAAGMGIALVRFRERPEEAAARLCPGVPVSPVADYLMWALTATGDHFGRPGDELLATDAATLHDLARTAVARWHPRLRTLVDRAAVPETFAVRISTAEPVPQWPASRITLLGDAIHTMSPAGGSGANTALTDAAILCAELVAAANGEKPLLTAIGAYETRMRDHGFAAVAAANQNATNMWARRHPILFRLARLLARRA